MRELKFRAWYLNERQYVHFSGIFNNRPIVNQSRELRDGKLVTTISYGGQIIEQYTGLKDKNGNEIYEGDVVVDRWANEYTPVFQNGIYMAYNPKHLTQNGPSTQFNVIWKDGCEVIGNIHEQEGE